MSVWNVKRRPNLLRSSLGTKDKQLITLSEEMLVLDHYLEIQRIRESRR
jgi:sensor histidine kinase YesM